MVGRGCSVVGLSGSRSLSMDGVLFVESDPVRNDGVDAHRARGVSLFRPWFHAPLFSCGLWRKSRGYACMRLIPDT